MTGIAAAVMQCIFWVLLVLVIVLPVRLSIVVYLILVQFDMGGLGNYSIGSLGFENAIKTIAIPSLLLARIRPLHPLPPGCQVLCRSWLLLICYAVIATSWSPFPLSGVKMVGYLYAYAIMFLVLTAAWQRGWLSDKSISAVVAITLVLAVLQSYVFGNPYGNPEYENRFTTFAGAATFSPFLLCLLVLILFRGALTTSKIVAAFGALVGLLLAGGRSAFVGFAWTLLMAGLAYTRRARGGIHFGPVLRTAALSALVVVCIIMMVQWLLPGNRLNEFFTSSKSGVSEVRNVETFAWRLDLYERALSELQNRGVSRLLIGSGTSSGVIVSLDNDFSYDGIADPNRSLHEEFLRSAYEWGLPGFGAIVLFLCASVRLGWRSARSGNREGWAFLAISVPILFSFLIENILADGASPGGIGYTLVLASMVASLSPNPVHVRLVRSDAEYSEKYSRSDARLL
jgi:O-Antigen ligase